MVLLVPIDSDDGRIIGQRGDEKARQIDFDAQRDATTGGEGTGFVDGDPAGDVSSLEHVDGAAKLDRVTHRCGGDDDARASIRRPRERRAKRVPIER